MSSEKNQARLRAEAKAARLQAKRDQIEIQKALDLQQEVTAKTTRWHELVAAAADEEMINPKGDPTLGKEIFKLCIRGVPPSMRGTVWPLLIGNGIKFSHEEFATLRKQADALRVSAGLGTAFGSRVSSQAPSAHGSKAHEADSLLDASMDSEVEGAGLGLGDSRLLLLEEGRSWDDDEAQLGSAGEETSPVTVGAESVGSGSHSRSGSGAAARVAILAAAAKQAPAPAAAEAEAPPAAAAEAPAAEAAAAAERVETQTASEKPAAAVIGSVDDADKYDPAPVEVEEEGEGEEKDIVFVPYVEPPSPVSASPKQVRGKHDDGATCDGTLSMVSDDIGIDLSRAFAYDMPTPPRRKSGAQVGPPRDTRGSLDGLMERLSELNRESALGSGTGISSAKQMLPIPQASFSAHNTAQLIKWDLPRTFPTLKFFHDGGSIQADLERILCAYTLYRPDVGYVQGMSFVAAMLLLYMDDAGAFQCLANLLARKGTRNFFSLQQHKVARYVHCFDHFFEQSLPLLFTHMRQQGLSSEMFLLDWHLTLFAKALPLDVAARVWDCYLAGGELFSLRCALGILRLYAPQLCLINMEELMAFLTHLPQDLKAEELLDSIAQIKISQGKYQRFQKSYNKELGVESYEDAEDDLAGGADLEDKSKSREGCVIQ